MIKKQYGEKRPLSRFPKQGNYRIIFVDTFDGDDFAADADTLEEATEFAKAEAGNMAKVYICQNGVLIGEYGSF